jgi:hypothetical protein
MTTTTPTTIAHQLRAASSAYVEAIVAVEDALVAAITDDAVLGELVDALGDLIPSGLRVGELARAIAKLDVIA